MEMHAWIRWKDDIHEMWDADLLSKKPLNIKIACYIRLEWMTISCSTILVVYGVPRAQILMLKRECIDLE